MGNNVATGMGREGQDLSEDSVVNTDVPWAKGGTFVVAKTSRRDVIGHVLKKSYVETREIGVHPVTKGE